MSVTTSDLTEVPTLDLLRKIVRTTQLIEQSGGHPADDSKVATWFTDREAFETEVLKRTALHDVALPDPRLPGMTHTSRAIMEVEIVTGEPVRREPKPGDYCKFLSGGRVEHFRCDQYANGVITKDDKVVER